jgi:hypothetical protein
MTKEMENASKVNNSSLTSTLDCESVSFLFGLTPREIHLDVFGYYYDTEKICSVALMDIFEHCQQKNDLGRDTSCELSFSKVVSIATELDRANQLYFAFKDKHPYNGMEAETSDYGEDDQSALELHKHLMGIIKKVHEFGGVYDFNCVVGSAIYCIKNKQAYRDMVDACFCINNIYIAYMRNVFALHKPVATVSVYGRRF